MLTVLVVVLGVSLEQAAKEADMADAAAPEEGDQSSSYDSEESEEEAPMGIHPDGAGDMWVERLADIKSCIATMDANQNAIVSQLASLEKVVMAVREDMTWVREDVRVVHEVVEKMADYVSMINNTVVEVEGVQTHRTPEVSPWGKWPVEPRAEEHVILDIPGVAEDDRVDLGHEEPSHINVPRSADSLVFETQMFDGNTSTDGYMESTEEEGAGGGWRLNLEGAFGVSPPSRKQARRRDEEDAQEPDYHQMEMTLDGTQTETQAPGPSLWSDSTNAVTDMPAPVFGGGANSDGWIASKRGRGSWSNYGARDTAETRGEEVLGHGNLNLNVTPPNLEVVEVVSGRGRASAITETATGSRGGGRGLGRGAGRAKGPPLVQPRYRSTASCLSVTFCMYLSY